MSVWELVSLPPRVMATSASTTTTRMAAAMSTAAVGSSPKIRRDSPEVRGEAETSPPGELLLRFSTVVDELDDWPGIGACAEGAEDDDEDVDVDVESSALGAVADDELELLDLSQELSFCWVWALDVLP